MATDYYTKTTRSMLSCVKEVGGMPFILFEYYLTWQTASQGIKPPLQTICSDLGLEKSAVCNLRSRLIKAGWIRYENDEIFIVKTFTKNEQNHSQKVNNLSQNVNDRSQKMNESFTKNEQTFTKNERLYKEENKQRTNNKNEQEEEENPRPKKRALSVDEVLKFDEQIEIKKAAYETAVIVLPKSIEIYLEYFPTSTLNPTQLGSFAERLGEVDETIWKQNLHDWKDMGWRANNFIGMVERYQTQLEKSKNGTSSGLPNRNRNGFKDKRERSAERQENGYAFVAALRADPPETDSTGQVLLGDGRGIDPEIG